MLEEHRVNSENTKWRDYYQKLVKRPPRELFLQALNAFSAPGLAVDLGCGSGIETRELLKRGWQVIAVDQEETAFEYLLPEVVPEHHAHLTTQRASFDEVTLPSVDFIWAGLSLPFCRPEQFPHVWEKITKALRSGGYFAGDLFGVHHAWRDNPAMTFVTMEEVRSLLQPFEIELLREAEEERPTACQGMQHWHGFDIIARKR
jgi:tellurite methyltransferase